MKKVESVLKPLESNVQVTAIAFIDNDLNLVNYSVKYQIPTPDKFDMWGKNRLDTLSQIVYNKTSIDRKHLIWSTDNYSGMDEAFDFETFGDGLLDAFLDYISAFPDKEDIQFLENLRKYTKTEGRKEKLDGCLLKAKAINGE